MNKSPSGRSVRRALATFAAAAALTGVFAAPAGADPAPVSSTPATSEAPASSTASAPSSSAAESAPPAAPKPQAERPNIASFLAFGKKSYRTDEDVSFTFKVTNIGETRAVGLKVANSLSDPSDLSTSDWGELDRMKPGLTLEPGATYEVKVAGKIQDIDSDKAVVRGFVHDETGFGVATFSESVALEKVAGNAAGVVFGDKNGNGHLDDGEQLAGITFTLKRFNGPTKYTATSDANGKIDFGDVPSAEYYLGGEVIKGWLFPFEFLRIGPDSKDLLVRGAPPLNGALKATMAFTQDSYKAGELAHLTVTLSNSGSIPLTGIVSACDRYGADYALKGNGEGWGELAYAGSGAKIAPGETRTFDVSERVPDASRDRGLVSASCDFGYRDVDIDNHAFADDRAPVPGVLATVAGDVVHLPGDGKPEKGIAGVKVVLVSDRDCPVVGERTTDENGRFEFRKVVPGAKYRLYFLTPQGWRIKDDNPALISVVGPEDKPTRVRALAEPGEAPRPSVPTQPPGCGETATPTPTSVPAGQGSGGGQGGSGLASTGADVLWLGALALAALGLGSGLVFGARRRRRLAD